LAPGYGGRAPGPWWLRRWPSWCLREGVDGFRRLLNGLPDRSAIGGEVACTDVGYGNMTFVFSYPRRPPVVVWVDRNCRSVIADGRARYGTVLDPFMALYQAQLRHTTRAEDVPTPDCVGSVPSGHFDTGGGDQPSDGIGANRPSTDPFLPSPLVAVTGCRYSLVHDPAVLVAHGSRRGRLDALRSIVNTQTARTPDYRPLVLRQTGCSDASNGSRYPIVVDVLWLADATGGVSEMRVWRTPCRAVITGYVVPIAPTDDVLRYLDGLLGTP
jgi:hypothetical protein